ncbi:NADPH-dependent FMN reductase [Zhihengliuella flava]|uniref:NAD(P)H-dependent FMN reductase n=1 Tax=Zhihengliuella flava TaxID=1285193 RepID=A0A931D939_9MICC|nr:NAD(P)H-dependent oxidoreductase [Zhihengliuella flava]MBG6084267.1 NAD(P)H-dependent FMN reductase [Zhihengliuella flava]
MLRIAVVTGSTRPSRLNPQVAQWAHEVAARVRPDVEFEYVDIADYALPLLDEPLPAGSGVYEREHTKVWSAKMASFDAYVFVTAEYNHVPSPALLNAIDFLFAEWADKSAGIVSYGGVKGARATEVLRQQLSAVGIAHVQKTVAFALGADFDEGTFTPSPSAERAMKSMLDQVIAWGRALQTVREQEES